MIKKLKKAVCKILGLTLMLKPPVYFVFHRFLIERSRFAIVIAIEPNTFYDN